MDWPLSCRYYDPRTADTAHIEGLYAIDSRFLAPEDVEQPLQHIEIEDGNVQLVSETVAALPVARRLHAAGNGQKSTKIFFVSQKRIYLAADTVCRISMREKSWRELLRALEVHPSFLELLYDNQGGYASHITYCADDTLGSCVARCSESTPNAFHVSLKIGSSGAGEFSLYARYSFQTGESIFLVAGTDHQTLPKTLLHKYSDNRHPSFFQVLLDVVTSWHRKAETLRWSIDYRTQEIESRTGFSGFQTRSLQPLTPDQLKFGRDIHIIADSIAFAAWGSLRIHGAFAFLHQQIDVFDELFCADSDSQTWTRVHRIIKGAIAQKMSLSEAQRSQTLELKRRVDSQLSVTKTLIAQRDTAQNLEIAKAAKTDSELMRSIAVVTMIFLPATFMATFFSMVFFHVGDEKSVRLLVDDQIWLYPAVTVPITLFVMFWYGWSSNYWPLFAGLKNIKVRDKLDAIVPDRWQKFDAERSGYVKERLPLSAR